MSQYPKRMDSIMLPLEFLGFDNLTETEPKFVELDHETKVHMSYVGTSREDIESFTQSIVSMIKHSEQYCCRLISPTELTAVMELIMKRYEYLKSQNLVKWNKVPVNDTTRYIIYVLDVSDVDCLNYEEQEKFKVNLTKILQLSRAVGINMVVASVDPSHVQNYLSHFYYTKLSKRSAERIRIGYC